MDIKTYIKQSRGKHARELASKAGTSVGYLRLMSYGLRTPSAEMAIRLEKASEGAILARELRPDLPWPSTEAA
ncbi:MAG: YdaS family helix-turn-helix protein [Candidatus Contendobacter sp.]|nr:YdaS family helix-turn-helix protein [Candidatus Contendobacter sp.]MDS4059655.1 YdaS family helix-turn-helix protein [Candidatus Contendobacter sp.]